MHHTVLTKRVRIAPSKVMVLYCDGASWSGSADPVSHPRLYGLKNTPLPSSSPLYGNRRGGPPIIRGKTLHSYVLRLLEWNCLCIVLRCIELGWIALWCIAAYWVGLIVRQVSHKGKTLHFRGKENLDALLTALLHTEGLDTATEVVINGGSAGGLAVYLHADYIVRAGFGPRFSTVLTCV